MRKWVFRYTFVPLSPSVYLPTTGLSLPQKENAPGVMSFRQDPCSSWTQLLVFKTPLKFVIFTLLAKHKITLTYRNQPEWLLMKVLCHFIMICMFENCLSLITGHCFGDVSFISLVIQSTNTHCTVLSVGETLVSRRIKLLMELICECRDMDDKQGNQRVRWW